MEPHLEIDSTRTLAHAVTETVWGWEVPVYLFLGGVTAGLVIVVSALVLLRGKEKITEGMRRGLLLAPVALSLGMGALFLDLTYKVHVFRFYLTWRPSAPMSFGSWVLILVYPIMLLLIVALPSRLVAPLLEPPKILEPLRHFAERNLARIAWAGLIGGVALGIYTGILLAVTVARPLWSSGALGLLFLTSGFVAGASVLSLLETEEESQTLLTRLPVAAIGLELVLVGSWLAGLLSQGPIEREAAGVVLWGSHAPAFLGLVLFGGMIVPATLEALSLRGRAAHSRLAPAVALIGGLLLRVVIVSAGQVVGYPAA